MRAHVKPKENRFKGKKKKTECNRVEFSVLFQNSQESVSQSINTGHLVQKKREKRKILQLTKTSCPVLLNPIPFFIKIKKKFIRFEGKKTVRE
jgi:hypothetical protein